MNLIFIGPQGSGKGTQAKKVAKKFGLCHISIGDLLRGVKGKLKVDIDKVMSRGDLVSDDLTLKILKKRLDRADCNRGFILDGFPRTVSQAESLKEMVVIDKVVEILISDKVAISRVSGRRSCSRCGAIYNVNSAPKPNQEGICDICGGRLIQRGDDNELALKKRLKVYHYETEKVLKMYSSFRVNGEQTIEKVFNDILLILK